MYIADANLLSGSGAIAYAAGSEVPEEALNSDMAKRMNWKDYVSEAKTKTMRADGPGTEKPTPAAMQAEAAKSSGGKS